MKPLSKRKKLFTRADWRFIMAFPKRRKKVKKVPAGPPPITATREPSSSARRLGASVK